MEKFSSRRQAVLDVIRNMRCHPSADTIYEECRKTIPNISLATVYRNLSYLEKKGLLGKVIGCGEKERYDIELDTHCHVICSNCGKITDMPYPDDMKSMLDKYCSNSDFSSFGLSFYNLCSDCRNKDK
ncbi:MAG: transcriptional repressor [Clostridia bacterium]|nr:transcriptional repressor [Clostridia bacterium]MDE7216310.1 transcriptional repressor [Clostridia bacterium]MDE7336974.1 transcriptional repressor [Clostridia bacterium]